MIIKKTKLTVLVSSIIVFCMLGLVYYSPTLYQLFCEVTGINGTPQKVEAASKTVSHRQVKIIFDSNIAPELPLKFFPTQKNIHLKIGETTTSYYIVENLKHEKINTMAVYNVEPAGVAKYVKKVECFCFSQQELLESEIKKMPIVYFISPEILEDPDFSNVKEIIFSYTLYES